jgi:putative ABC transport system substrate-binding protein
LEVDVLKAVSADEIDVAFDLLGDLHGGALVVPGDPFFSTRREQLVSLAAHYRVPAIYAEREFVNAGGLISYGANLTAVFYQLGIYAGRVLNGEKPADLPIEQPTKFELVINLKTAKGLGLAVPQSLLARADEVIE